ncbi:MAG: guanylate kinase [Dehalococcoidia bacterium]|nr:guanylate kinase [Dehalococcoidia bacterium]
MPGPAGKKRAKGPRVRGDKAGSDAPSRHPLLVVLSGPSGVGKDSVLAGLKARGGGYHFAVTATTRPPRPGEVDGRSYHFLTRQRFEEMAAAGELLENAVVYDERYGVPKAQVREALARGQDVVMRTDIQGVAAIKGAVPQAVTIFLAPASVAELEERLRLRGADSEEQLRLRLATARREMDAACHFDHVVVNAEGKLEEAVAEVERIIAAERAREGRGPIQL